MLWLIFFSFHVYKKWPVDNSLTPPFSLDYIGSYFNHSLKGIPGSLHRLKTIPLLRTLLVTDASVLSLCWACITSTWLLAKTFPHIHYTVYGFLQYIPHFHNDTFKYQGKQLFLFQLFLVLDHTSPLWGKFSELNLRTSCKNAICVSSTVLGVLTSTQQVIA